MKTIFPALLAAAAVTLSPGAGAAPLIWTLLDVELDDGGIVTGQFTYDAGSNTFSGVNVVASGLPGTVFNVVLEGDAESLALVPAGPLAGAPLLQLIFDAPLSDLEGTFIGLVNPFLPAASSFQALCEDAGCVSAVFQRSFVDGGVLSSPVPLPAAAWLLGGALGALPLVRRRS